MAYIDSPIFPDIIYEDFYPPDDNDPEAIYAQYDQLRKKCPLAYTSQNGGYWTLTRYDDVKQAASDTNTFISSVKAVIPSDPRGTRRPPLNTDPPVHTPYRTALDRTLKPSRIKRLDGILDMHAEREFAKLLKQGSGDICMQFTAKFAAWVEVTWLNLADETAPLLANTAAAWVHAWREQRKDEVMFHSNRLYDIARALFADRKRRPRNPEEDPASSLLLEKGPDGVPLTEEQLVSVFTFPFLLSRI